MDSVHHDGGKSTGLVLMAVLLRAVVNNMPNTETMTKVINTLTIVTLILGITYHLLGIRERVIALVQYIRTKYPKKQKQ